MLFKFDVIKEMEKQFIQQPLDLVDVQPAWDFLEADVYGGGRGGHRSGSNADGTPVGTRYRTNP